MKIGTKSILYGAHCFLIHPAFVFLAWWKLYSFPWDPRLWIAFFVHDFGYWGKPNMDGPQGEEHPELGGRIMSFFGQYWQDLTRYHSWYYANKYSKETSQLWAADKLAVCLEPKWLYLPRIRWTGEIKEYMDLSAATFDSPEQWHKWVTRHLRRKAYQDVLRWI